MATRISGPMIANKLVSTGIAGIDFLLGGGVPGGSIVLIEESKHTNGYADVFAKLFLAEAFYRKNRIYFASDGTLLCSEFLRTLPQAVVDDSISNEENVATASRNMEIAFRYEHLPATNLRVASERRRERHSFDLSRPISAEDLSRYTRLITYDAGREVAPSVGHLAAMLAQLKELLFHVQSNEDQDDARWHRICIRNFGSPLWFSSNDQEFSYAPTMVKFLASLRTFLRQKSTAVALITVSTAFCDYGSPLLHRLRQLADVVLRLDPIRIGENEKSVLDYHGFLRCLRTPSINSISHPIPDCADFAFKLKKKELLIERLHLPPDLSETVSRSQLESFSCAPSSSRSKLDF